MDSTNARNDLHVDMMFLGGVGDDVTGSSTLLCFRVGEEKRFGLVDVGGFQGEGKRNYFYPVRADKIDFVVITHEHFDHIGLLPKLYRDGFRGKVFITEQAMCQGIKILEDAANIQRMEADTNYFSRKDLEKGKKDFVRKKNKMGSLRDIRGIDHSISLYDAILDDVLYTTEDVKALHNSFVIVRPEVLTTVYQGLLSFRFRVNPHINGAVEVTFYYGKEEKKLGIFFSGDVGSSNSLLYRERDLFRYDDAVDFLVMESLHGTDEREQTLEESTQELQTIIKNGIQSGKSIILVGFSLDRNAMLTLLMNRMLVKERKFDAYFDSPLGFMELSLYQAYYTREKMDASLKDNEKWFKDLGPAPFDLGRFKKLVQKVNDHILLLNTSGPKVVITASANGSGGRVVDYFHKFIQDEKTIFVFCGWISPDSPSNVLHETKTGEIVELGGRKFIKKCETVRLHGFSSHGYYEEFLSILDSFPSKKGVILTHGAMDKKFDLKDMIASSRYQTMIPCLYDAYHLSKEKMEEMAEDEKMRVFGEVLDYQNIHRVLQEIEELSNSKT